RRGARALPRRPEASRRAPLPAHRQCRFACRDVPGRARRSGDDVGNRPALMPMLKVLFVTQNDPIYVREFFEELLQVAPERIHVAGIVLAPAMGKRSVVDLARQMWEFYGPIDFVRMGLRYALLRIGAR